MARGTEVVVKARVWSYSRAMQVFAIDQAITACAYLRRLLLLRPARS
jgi:hypothetical protein